VLVTRGCLRFAGLDKQRLRRPELTTDERQKAFKVGLHGDGNLARAARP
jgi:hypothetical protein